MRLATCVLAPIAGLGCTVNNPAFLLSTESWSSQAGTASDSTAATTSAASPTTSTASVSTGESSATATAVATSTGATAATSTGTSLGVTEGSTGDPPCEPDAPPNAVANEAVITAAYADDYRAYVLGPVPGIPAGSDLGGMAIHDADVNTLVIAGNAETPAGKLYEIGVERGPCGHIIGFAGEATEVAMTPHVSDLLFVSGGLLFYTEWPKNHIAQLLPGASTPALRTDLGKLGITSARAASAWSRRGSRAPGSCVCSFGTPATGTTSTAARTASSSISATQSRPRRSRRNLAASPTSRRAHPASTRPM